MFLARHETRDTSRETRDVRLSSESHGSLYKRLCNALSCVQITRWFSLPSTGSSIDYPNFERVFPCDNIIQQIRSDACKCQNFACLPHGLAFYLDCDLLRLQRHLCCIQYENWNFPIFSVYTIRKKKKNNNKIVVRVNCNLLRFILRVNANKSSQISIAEQGLGATRSIYTHVCNILTLSIITASTKQCIYNFIPKCGR